MKNLFSFIYFVLCIGLLGACSKQDCSKQNENSVQYEQLAKTLEDYRSDFISSRETKSSFWKALGRIALNDAFGAALGSSALGPGGGIFGALVASTNQFVTEIAICYGKKKCLS